jgi:transcriptional regulator with XRE-family HTH domain
VVSREFQAPQIKAAFGEAVAACRHDLGLSQEALCDQSGVAARAISRMECGEGNPTYFTLKRLADGLGIAASTILARAEEIEKGEVAMTAKPRATDPKASARASAKARKKSTKAPAKPRTPVRERRAQRKGKSEDAGEKP